MAIGSSFSYLASLVFAGVTTRRIAKALRANTQTSGSTRGCCPRALVARPATGRRDLPALLAPGAAGRHRPALSQAVLIAAVPTE